MSYERKAVKELGEERKEQERCEFCGVRNPRGSECEQCKEWADREELFHEVMSRHAVERDQREAGPNPREEWPEWL